MNGTHGYRRIDAREALAEGLAGKLPASWRHAEENAAVEARCPAGRTIALIAGLAQRLWPLTYAG